MHISRLLAVFSLSTGMVFGQLTTDQKVADFQYLAGVFAKRYGPYEWKRDVVKFDLYDVSPWVKKVEATKTDLEFYDLMSEYVASLNDAHSVYLLPSSYIARLNFTVDLYDGKLIVDFINRTRLPASEFGFVAGYELVSIDGVDGQKILDKYLRYQVAANERSTRRLAATLITTRPQQLIPSAADVPDISTVVFRRPDGGLETHRIPWARSGVPLTSVGRYTTPTSQATRGEDDDGPAPPVADYMEVLQRLQNCRVPERGVLNFGAVQPIFVNALPASFTVRLGFSPSDPFFSGTFESGGYRIGYIRIPDYGPADPNGALTAFAKEIAFFQENTDGLVVDEMRNPGGSVGYANQIVSYLTPTMWTAVGFEVRATSEWVLAFSGSVESAKAQGAPDIIIALLQRLKDSIMSANRANRGRTEAIPLDDLTLERLPALDAKGTVLAYRKPILLLVDEMSASAADMVAATLQDAGRAKLFGWRTMGAGGNVEGWWAGSYSLGIADVTESLMSRNKDVVTPDYPVTRYVENVGVRPDMESDYMTAENLRRQGGVFVEAFSKAITDLIKNSPKSPEVKP